MNLSCFKKRGGSNNQTNPEQKSGRKKAKREDLRSVGISGEAGHETDGLVEKDAVRY